MLSPDDRVPGFSHNSAMMTSQDIGCLALLLTGFIIAICVLAAAIMVRL